VGDENQPSLITDDFDDDSHFAINEDAGIVVNVEPNENVDGNGDEEEEDEFCQAIASQIRTTTKDGCSFICVQPSSLTAAIIGENRTFVWSINNGDRYNSATDFFKFVNKSVTSWYARPPHAQKVQKEYLKAFIRLMGYTHSWWCAR